ncbi:hypothetical protein CEY12_06275 [Chryseobacterium sp. T16E-39]|uniref:hypothetical protein n=1 Tax=Chryseobacterium sp. T16E-39 TaxID=2015076 RepID=UPI000B5B2653|nr:hypothetical protein [Chryseobacterium sp. T16E-39]ASK29735.1 hypothetical protein CEY12_06275 [Chryseobacterium sp. T16E-39]
MKAKIKNYTLSQDYEHLWNLISEGHRLAAWLLYSDKFSEPIYDIVEVRINRFGEHNIGTRGIRYSGYETGKEGFLRTCEHYDLKFINPINSSK